MMPGGCIVFRKLTYVMPFNPPGRRHHFHFLEETRWLPHQPRAGVVEGLHTAATSNSMGGDGRHHWQGASSVPDMYVNIEQCFVQARQNDAPEANGELNKHLQPPGLHPHHPNMVPQAGGTISW